MKSRTFCCNGTLLKKALQRGLPLWGIYLLCWVVALPLNMISSSDWIEVADAERRVLEAAAVNAHIIPFLYGLAVACLLFSYLYKSRSANFFAALPLRRETHFVTNYTAGLLYALLPNLVIAALTVLSGLFVEANLIREVLIWFGLSALSYVFFFSFAVFCAMLVGHLAALPILYGIANFAVILLEAIISDLMSTFVFGMYYNGDGRLLPLSPVAKMLSDGIPDVHTVWEQEIQVGATINGWEYLLILFAAGIVFAVLAFFLRKGRRMEAAGDVIAVHRLKPVFLYCFTVGCSLVLGYVLAAMLVDQSNSGNFFAVLLCLLAGAFLGYFGGQMMLHKSFRVFRKQYWVNLAVVCAVITAAMTCCRLDVLGYSRYVPDADQVAAVSLDYGDSEYTDDPTLIAKVIALHEDILAHQDYIEDWDGNYGRTRTTYLNYQLNSGKTVRRRYHLPIDKNDTADDTMIRQYEEIYNDPAYVLERSLPTDYTAEDIQFSTAWDKTNSEHALTRQQAYHLLKYGVEEDIKAGVLETRYWSTDDGPTVAKFEYLELHFEVSFEGTEDTNWNNRYCSFSFNTECANSLKILKEYGLIVEEKP